MTSEAVPIRRAAIRELLTIDEPDTAVDKVIDALPDSLDDEWLTGLKVSIDFPPISEEDEEAFRHAFWQAARVTVEGLVKHGLAAEPFVASIEAITGVD